MLWGLACARRIAPFSAAFGSHGGPTTEKTNHRKELGTNYRNPSARSRGGRRRVPLAATTRLARR